MNYFLYNIVYTLHEGTEVQEVEGKKRNKINHEDLNVFMNVHFLC